MYLSRPIRRTRSTSPGAGPNPSRFSTCTMVLSSGWAGTPDANGSKNAGQLEQGDDARNSSNVANLHDDLSSGRRESAGLDRIRGRRLNVTFVAGSPEDRSGPAQRRGYPHGLSAALVSRALTASVRPGSTSGA